MQKSSIYFAFVEICEDLSSHNRFRRGLVLTIPHPVPGSASGNICSAVLKIPLKVKKIIFNTIIIRVQNQKYQAKLNVMTKKWHIGTRTAYLRRKTEFGLFSLNVFFQFHKFLDITCEVILECNLYKTLHRVARLLQASCFSCSC